MREFGLIYTQFWTSPDIRGLSNEARLLAAYLLTNQHCTMTGLYRIPVGYVAEDLGWDHDTVSKGFDELCHMGFITREEPNDWTLVHKFLKWNTLKNQKHAIGFEKVYDQIPDSVNLKSSLAGHILEYAPRFLSEEFAYRLHTVSEPSRYKEKEKESIERTRLNGSAVSAPTVPGQGGCDVF